MKIVTIVGARPQFIKAAPVSRALRAAADVTEVMVHTGQHFDERMSRVFFDELEIAPPAVNLGVKESSHARMTGAMLAGIEEILKDERPDGVLIYGDTNSTLAGALAAAKLALPIFHVEAGLRSFRATQPEEINRKVADHVSTLLFCPTEASVKNLRREGIVDGIHQVGDVMYDIALVAAASSRGADILAKLDVARGRYCVATVHRAESTDDRNRLTAILSYLDRRANQRPVILPLHPRTARAIERFGLTLGKVTPIEPLGYFEMAHLVRQAAEILTDSGGLQKEAYFHRVPCVTLRDETEWVETIEAGWNRLWTVSEYASRRTIDDYGDGHSAEKIVTAIGSLRT